MDSGVSDAEGRREDRAAMHIIKKEEMEKEKIELEHAHVKEVLGETSDFISSERFYSLPFGKQRLLTVRKVALETYLKTLSIELWGRETETVDLSQLMIAGLATAFNPTFPDVIPPVTNEKKTDVH